MIDGSTSGLLGLIKHHETTEESLCCWLLMAECLWLPWTELHKTILRQSELICCFLASGLRLDDHYSQQQIKPNVAINPKEYPHHLFSSLSQAQVLRLPSFTWRMWNGKGDLWCAIPKQSLSFFFLITGYSTQYQLDKDTSVDSPSNLSWLDALFLLTILQ